MRPCGRRQTHLKTRPQHDVHEEGPTEVRIRPNDVKEVAFGLGQGLQGHGPAAAAQQGLDEADRQRREHRRLLRVLADEVEHQLVGETHEDLAAGA